MLKTGWVGDSNHPKFGFSFNRLQSELPRFRWSGRALVAWLMVVYVLLLGAMVASPGLHSHFHPDADKAGHECAVTLFSHGQVDAAVTVVTVALLALSSLFLRFNSTSVCPAWVAALPPGRGPPVLA